MDVINWECGDEIQIRHDAGREAQPGTGPMLDVDMANRKWWRTNAERLREKVHLDHFRRSSQLARDAPVVGVKRYRFTGVSSGQKVGWWSGAVVEGRFEQGFHCSPLERLRRCRADRIIARSVGDVSTPAKLINEVCPTLEESANMFVPRVTSRRRERRGSSRFL